MVAKKTGKAIQKGKKLKGATLTTPAKLTTHHAKLLRHAGKLLSAHALTRPGGIVTRKIL